MFLVGYKMENWDQIFHISNIYGTMYNGSKRWSISGYCCFWYNLQWYIAMEYLWMSDSLPRVIYTLLTILGHRSSVIWLRYESSTLILYKKLSSSIFQSCEWVLVRDAWHPSKSPLFAIYKGMNVLYWPSIINYQLLPPHSVLY